MDLSLETFKLLKITPSTNVKWQLTNFYSLCCNSEILGCTFFTSINKNKVDSPIEALAHILQRFCDELEGGFRFDLSWDQLHSFYQSEGYLCANESTSVSKTDFIKDYMEIIGSISKSDNYTITKNGVNQDKFLLINHSKILKVENIINQWNYRQYFLETQKKFIFFSWNTTA